MFSMFERMPLAAASVRSEFAFFVVINTFLSKWRQHVLYVWSVKDCQYFAGWSSRDIEGGIGRRAVHLFSLHVTTCYCSHFGILCWFVSSSLRAILLCCENFFMATSFNRQWLSNLSLYHEIGLFCSEHVVTRSMFTVELWCSIWIPYTCLDHFVVSKRLVTK